MSSAIVIARAFELRREHVGSGTSGREAERLAVKQAAREHNTYVRQIVGYFIRAVDLGASEDEALCLTERLFAGTSSYEAEKAKDADHASYQMPAMSLCSECGEECATDELYDTFSEDGDEMFLMCGECFSPTEEARA